MGIVRNEEGLREAIGILSGLQRTPRQAATRVQYEVRNMADVALLIARCALARRESRGGHKRTDYPDKSPAFQKHSRVRAGSEPWFVDAGL